MQLRGSRALITGATSGIGLATAEVLAESGVHLILTGRRHARLKEIATVLSRTCQVDIQTLHFDLSDRGELSAALKDLGEPGLSQLDILVNNAGLALGTESMAEANLDDWETMIDTNIKGLLYMTRACLPHMIANGSGHIVNLGSVAGRWTYPGGGVYCATKFAVRALSEGLRHDLLGKPIRVTNIEPGMVETEFSLVRTKSIEKAKSVYQGMVPLSARDIAESIVWCLERPAHVNIQELVIYPTDQSGTGPAYTSRKVQL